MRFSSRSAKIALLPLASVGALTLVNGGSAGASSKGTTVKAVETDYHIALSTKTFSAGTYTFVAQNKGKVTHSLEITGPGLHNASTRDVAPGHSVDLKVTLKNGKYDIFCPLPGHKMLGMNVNVVVSATNIHTSSGQKKTSTTSPPSSGGGAGGISY